jgi:hypothetical protein
VEREKEKVISSEIIPTVPKMMAYQVLCGVWKRKGQRERERGREVVAVGGVVLLRTEKNKN